MSITKNTNKLFFGHANVFHLENKLHDIYRLLSGPPCLHLLGLTETRLKLQPDNALTIPNYSFF